MYNLYPNPLSFILIIPYQNTYMPKVSKRIFTWVFRPKFCMRVSFLIHTTQSAHLIFLDLLITKTVKLNHGKYQKGTSRLR
jgi:hypothetical protein